MNTSTDWDVEQFKAEHESDEHWELRRKFLLTHKDKFPEDELLCLAQVFTNVEILGCRYIPSFGRIFSFNAFIFDLTFIIIFFCT